MTGRASVRASIIVPVRNGQRFLAQALSSIVGNASAADELIVIDDGSTDGTAAILDAFQQDHACLRLGSDGVGPAGARNLGLEVAAGRFIAFLDHDDQWPAGRLDAHCGALERNGAPAIMGKTRYVVEDEAQSSRFRFPDGQQAGHLHHLGASTFRREVFQQHGRFDPDLRFSEDQDFFLRLADAGCDIRRVPEIGLLYRVHETNMTRGVPTRDLGLFQVLHASIQRRRAAGASTI
ncbi:glycosyltransferase [Pigmentiphaga sp.]|uniref:glycosyltransferase family 2 protein n=1 Tax=Pigmentiphaga sp. TaxID=1977564 RepID=UPI0025D76AF9|nr:glycosyltransferase [Pigmentiphaga sp.]